MTLPTARPAVLATAVLGLVSLALTALPSAAGAARVEGGAGQTVAIADNKFVPNSIGVHEGESVVWINTDDVPHKIESTSGPETFGTGEEVLKKGQSYTFTFTKEGIYHFVCSLHPSASGTITVGEGARTTTSDDGGMPDGAAPNGGLLAPLLPH
jgi:plastocyanin